MILLVLFAVCKYCVCVRLLTSDLIEFVTVVRPSAAPVFAYQPKSQLMILVLVRSSTLNTDSSYILI
jgi:hypothetical protein